MTTSLFCLPLLAILMPNSIFKNPRGSETVLVRGTSAARILATRYSIPSRRASDSLRPTRANSGSVNMQNGTKRFLVMRLPSLRWSYTTRNRRTRDGSHYSPTDTISCHAFGSSASCSWPIASRRCLFSLLQLKMTFCE